MYVVYLNYMKRYLVFYGYDYYPSGGMNDFIGSFDHIIECELSILKEHKKDGNDVDDWEYRWKQIYDIKEKKFIINTFN